MAHYPDGPQPSTPESTAAVAQSRTGTAPAVEEAGPATPERYPGERTDFAIGRGVERAARARPYERQPGDPVYRPLRIYTLDPTASRLEGALATVNVPYEPLTPGPRGALVEVDNRDGWRGVTYEPVDLDDPRVLIQNGRTPSAVDHLFHQQMVYAVTSTVCAAFQRALGRHTAWGFDGPEPGPSRLRLRPHACNDRNACYDQANGEVRFGYYQADADVTGRNAPGGFVFTCLSHDIVAHEVTHALLDGMREHFREPSGPDVLAFHEAFADLVAFFQHFSYEKVVEAAIRNSRGNLGEATLLTDIARQFGETTGLSSALRSVVDDLKADGTRRLYYKPHLEPHQLGLVLVAAVFEAFVTVFQRKTARYIRLATGGTGVIPAGELAADLQAVLARKASLLANQFLTICIRAIDYCPPVDLRFGEYLRALITADYDLVPDDPWGYREALIDAFWRRKIYPPQVWHLAEDALLWDGPDSPCPPIQGLTFAALQFAGDPSLPAGPAELRRQACALGDILRRPRYLAQFGLVRQGDPRLAGDRVDLPCVQSIRTTRRVGPNGQIVFDLVAEVTQRRTVYSGHGKPDYDFYGGATVIVGPNGTIRYVIAKNVLSERRQKEQEAFMAGGGQRFWAAPAAGGKRTPDPRLLQRLHELRTAPAPDRRDRSRRSGLGGVRPDRRTPHPRGRAWPGA